jgi:hypothetical protein
MIGHARDEWPVLHRATGVSPTRFLARSGTKWSTAEAGARVLSG